MKSFASQAAWTLVFNYFDNFIGVSPPTLATSHFHELAELLHHLCLGEPSTKSCPPSPVMTCLGVQFNTLDFTLSVDSDHLAEIETSLHAWLHKPTTTKSPLQSLLGKLVFVRRCV